MNDDWPHELAEELARAGGIGLGEKHWRVIIGSRDLIARYRRSPSLAEVSANCGVSLAEVKQLFPGVVEEVLARLAGAPELERRRAS